MGNKRRYDFTIPADIEMDSRLRDLLNARFATIAEGLEAQAGLRGLVSVGNDLDMGGFRIKNLGDPELATDASTKRHTDVHAALSTARLLTGDGVGIDLIDTNRGDDAIDDGAASAVRTITLAWRNAKKGHVARWIRPKNNRANIKYYEVVFFNGGNYLIVDDGTSTTTRASAIKQTGGFVYRTHLNKKKLHSNFTTGVDVQITPVSLINGELVRGTPATFGSLVVAGNDNVTANDAINVLDVGMTVGSNTDQLVPNGDFAYGSATVLKAWRRITSAFASWTADDVNITTTGTEPWFWETADHRIGCRDKDHFAIASLGRTLMPGAFYSVNFWIKSDGAFTCATRVLLRNNSGTNVTVDESGSAVTAYDDLALTTSQQIAAFKLRLDPNAGGGGKVWVSIEFNTALLDDGGSRKVFIDRVKVNEGLQPSGYSRRTEIKETNNAGILDSVGGALVYDEDYDVTPNSVGTPPDAVQVSGTQGRYRDTVGGILLDVS